MSPAGPAQAGDAWRQGLLRQHRPDPEHDRHNGLARRGLPFFLRKLGQGRLLWWKAPVPAWVRKLTLLLLAFALVVLYTGLSANLNLSKKGVAIVGVVPAGLPPIVVPTNLGTNIPNLISIVIVITIIGYLESIAVETKFRPVQRFKYQVISPSLLSF